MCESLPAGKPAPPLLLLNVPRRATASSTRLPDLGGPARRLASGALGRREASLDSCLNEDPLRRVQQEAQAIDRAACKQAGE